MPFEKGKSGNPQGRPRGSRNQLNRAISDVLSSNPDLVAQKLKEAIAAGDPRMLMVIFKRYSEPACEYDLPPVNNLSDLKEAYTQVLLDASSGELPIDHLKSIYDRLPLYEEFLVQREKIETNPA